MRQFSPYIVEEDVEKVLDRLSTYTKQHTQIGDALNKNHSTMTIHYRDVSNLLKSNKEMKDTVDDIIKNLKEK